MPTKYRTLFYVALILIFFVYRIKYKFHAKVCIEMKIVLSRGKFICNFQNSNNNSNKNKKKKSIKMFWNWFVFVINCSSFSETSICIFIYYKWLFHLIVGQLSLLVVSWQILAFNAQLWSHIMQWFVYVHVFFFFSSSFFI